MVLNSPGSKVPSHGTDSFASTYAFDLLQVDWTQKSVKFHRKSTLDQILGRVHLNDCYSYGKPIYAPISAGWLLLVMDTPNGTQYNPSVIFPLP